MADLLIADDDAHILQSLKERLVARGHNVLTATTGKDALAKIRKDRPELALLDLQMPDGDGMSVLQKVKEEGLDVTVVVITAFGSVERAVAAVRAGAYDFIQKPFEPALVEEVIRRALERASLQSENRALRLGKEDAGPVVEDVATREVFNLAVKAAKSSATVLLLGESGTGKEVLAREIHRLSPRAAAPFVAVNCVALAENLLESELFGHEKGAFTGATGRRTGKIELAHRGTLFLDEIGDITPAFQAKLLRVLQERSFERVGGNDSIAVDIRVVAATHRDLKAAVSDGKFREDLFYRLNVVTIAVPALRDRKADIQPLVQRFLEGACRDAKRSIPKISKELTRFLESYSWPGNVRELKNVIERAVVLLEGDELGLDDLPGDLLTSAPEATPAGGFHTQVSGFRKALIKETLDKCGGNQTKAAEALGLQRTYLARLVRQLGLAILLTFSAGAAGADEVHEVVRDLQSKDAQVREAAEKKIYRLGSRAEIAVGEAAGCAEMTDKPRLERLHRWISKDWWMKPDDLARAWCRLEFKDQEFDLEPVDSSRSAALAKLHDKARFYLVKSGRKSLLLYVDRTGDSGAWLPTLEAVQSLVDRCNVDPKDLASAGAVVTFLFNPASWEPERVEVQGETVVYHLHDLWHGSGVLGSYFEDRRYTFDAEGKVVEGGDTGIKSVTREDQERLYDSGDPWLTLSGWVADESRERLKKSQEGKPRTPPRHAPK